ncbi:MAG: hypothetical protein CM15mP23_06760 [Cryomorphaceae bacterium]|nr:MAG: hypothetical protein CM15mP23_06760 [Cryomorphaceae bacterium]
MKNIIPPLSIDLNVGWNLIGYPCAEGENAEAAFNLIVENIEIVKIMVATFIGLNSILMGLAI